MTINQYASDDSESDYLHHLLDDTESEEDEDEEISILLLGAAAAADSTLRPSCHARDRLDWDAHVAKLFDEGPLAFYSQYRMGYSSFVKLCLLIDPIVSVDPVYSRNRTGTTEIKTEIVLHCLLRWLAGGSYLDIRLSAGISKASFFACILKCIHEILCCNELAYKFPTTNEEIKQVANDFKRHSTNNVIDGCVGCLDGLLLQIQTPSASETGNVKAYFSGHYRTYGVNVQAACDSRCRFIYASVAAPGGTNDITAFRKTSLYNLVESLPLGKYIIGDNAYICTEHILTPFPGEQKKEPKKDAYNFYLSQLRV